MPLTIILALLIFGFLIAVHEFGHFITAKAVGIRVHEFAIGMGPVILKKTKGDTEYALRLFPIGGFVRMEGEDEASDDLKSFGKKSGWAKTLVVCAGSAMNFITAMLIIMVMLFVMGAPSNGVRELAPGGPAELAGIKAGDEIIAIDGTATSTWESVSKGISQSSADTIALTIQRPGVDQPIQVTADTAKDPSGKKIIGIYPAAERNFFMAIEQGFFATFDLLKQMFASIGMLITGSVPMSEVVGPIGIVSVMGDMAQKGVLYVANLTAIISLNLALINMLPIPALDGGRLLFIIIEAVRGKPMNPEKEGYFHYIGFILLIGLMIVVTFKDIGQFILN